MTQKIEHGRGNVQIQGNDNAIFMGSGGFQPDPDNPNLISCPGCGKYGVHREADTCPECGYNFKAKRLEAQDLARRQFNRGVRALLTFVVLVATLATVLASSFDLDFIRAIAGAFILVLLGYSIYLWIFAQGLTWFRQWQGKL